MYCYGNECTCDLKYWLHDENKTTLPRDDTLLNDVKTVNNDTTPNKVNADLCVGTVSGDTSDSMLS